MDLINWKRKETTQAYSNYSKMSSYCYVITYYQITWCTLRFRRRGRGFHCTFRRNVVNMHVHTVATCEQNVYLYNIEIKTAVNLTANAKKGSITWTQKLRHGYHSVVHNRGLRDLLLWDHLCSDLYTLNIALLLPYRRRDKDTASPSMSKTKTRDTNLKPD